VKGPQSLTLAFEGDALEITRKFPERKGDELVWKDRTTKGSYRLYPNTDPRGIDLTEERNGKAATAQGVYSLDGDTLTVCVPEAGSPRPTKIKSTKEPQLHVLMFKRRKK
jgi:uncharacterized protein (TIGR03067 family)